MAVLLPDGASGLEPLAVALPQHTDGCFDARFIAGQGGSLCHGGKLTSARREGKPDDCRARRRVRQGERGSRIRAGRKTINTSSVSHVPGVRPGLDFPMGTMQVGDHAAMRPNSWSGKSRRSGVALGNLRSTASALLKPLTAATKTPEGSDAKKLVGKGGHGKSATPP